MDKDKEALMEKAKLGGFTLALELLKDREWTKEELEMMESTLSASIEMEKVREEALDALKDGPFSAGRKADLRKHIKRTSTISQLHTLLTICRGDVELAGS